MEHTPHLSRRSTAGVPTGVQWLAVLASTGLTGLLLLGLALVTVEYRPSGASLLQQAIVAFAAAGLSMCMSEYLLRRPLPNSGQSRLVFLLLFTAIGSALALYLRESWVWDLPARLVAALALLSTVTSGIVVFNSVRGRYV